MSSSSPSAHALRNQMLSLGCRGETHRFAQIGFGDGPVESEETTLIHGRTPVDVCHDANVRRHYAGGEINACSLVSSFLAGNRGRFA